MAGKLKPLDVERETRPGKYPDGDGLYLVVASATSKNWSYRYWIDGKQRWLGLGSVKDVSLKEARLARDAARLRVKGDRSTPGVDIVQEKRAAREESEGSTDQGHSAYISAVRRRLHSRALVDLGARSIVINGHRRSNGTPIRRSGNSPSPRLSPATSTNCSEPIWVEKRETANRVRARIETIIAKNVDVDDTDFRNPAELTKQLREKLPNRPKRVPFPRPIILRCPTPKHRSSWLDLSAAGGIAASMLCFLIFTACRTNEVVEVPLDRDRSTVIDLEENTGERMKMHQDHVVPAFRSCTRRSSTRCCDGTQGELIFPNPDDGSVFRECHARRAGSPRLRSRYRAWIPLDLRNLGRRMHGLP